MILYNEIGLGHMYVMMLFLLLGILIVCLKGRCCGRMGIRDIVVVQLTKIIQVALALKKDVEKWNVFEMV